MRLTVRLDNRSGNATTIRNFEALPLRPRTNLRVLQALVRVARIAAAASRANLTASLNVRLNSLGEFLEMRAVQINLVRSAVKGETHRLIGRRAIEIVNNFHDLRRLLHILFLLRDQEFHIPTISGIHIN